MSATARKTACITLICNVIFGNLVLAFAPFSAIRFNYYVERFGPADNRCRRGVADDRLLRASAGL